MERDNRKSQYNRLIKKYPQTKCTYNDMSELGKNFYDNVYKNFDINPKHGGPYNKAFALTSDCKNFKFHVRNMIDTHPEAYEQYLLYEKCVRENPLDFKEVCKKYRKNIEDISLKDIAKYTLNSCEKSNPNKKCGLYNINCNIYKQNLLYNKEYFILNFVILIIFVLIILIIYYKYPSKYTIIEPSRLESSRLESSRLESSRLESSRLE
jgi:hypothetical protein